MSLVPPCPRPELPQAEVSHPQLLAQLKSLKEKGSQIYSTVLEKLHDIKVDGDS